MVIVYELYFINLSSEAYLWFKSLHIIGVIVWFSGLFYLVRLFIYHEESRTMQDDLKIAFNDQYSLMEKRLANIITTPGMILALSMAICLVIMQPGWLSEKWLQIKISFVLGLSTPETIERKYFSDSFRVAFRFFGNLRIHLDL